MENRQMITFNDADANSNNEVDNFTGLELNSILLILQVRHLQLNPDLQQI